MFYLLFTFDRNYIIFLAVNSVKHSRVRHEYITATQAQKPLSIRTAHIKEKNIVLTFSAITTRMSSAKYNRISPKVERGAKCTQKK